MIRRALAETHKAGLGKIALSGRERLLAISAPSDASLPGLMAYGLRYAEEMRSAAEYFSGIKTPAVDAESLSLAKDLIQRKTAKFDLSEFTDQYEAALRELIEAKMKHRPLPAEEKPAPRGKVINLMDALRRSVGASGEKKPRETKTKKPAKRAVAVMPAHARRKSA